MKSNAPKAIWSDMTFEEFMKSGQAASQPLGASAEPPQSPAVDTAENMVQEIKALLKRALKLEKGH